MSYLRIGNDKKLSEMKEVERGKDMDNLLYDLLTTQSYKDFNEDKIRTLILKAVPKTLDTTVDDKGNLFIEVPKADG